MHLAFLSIAFSNCLWFSWIDKLHISLPISLIVLGNRIPRFLLQESVGTCYSYLQRTRGSGIVRMLRRLDLELSTAIAVPPPGHLTSLIFLPKRHRLGLIILCKYFEALEARMSLECMFSIGLKLI